MTALLEGAAGAADALLLYGSSWAGAPSGASSRWRLGGLDASPAAYVRRPSAPAEPPALGLSQLQFEAMIVAARTPLNRYDFALAAMPGLLDLRIFE
ncbi:hypothetical protein F4553_000845 [Allocatelliglobosispora scoriae]|uniref:Uncharacterized protein n=1 Tax=Allocatelliglobosispora scoriae TaxID=643052 RepID=A0A841BJT5_9ACTN|nr:hypothetical protein [Allocatelliglobosispora scoriae]MBB5867466.1 hypothetical protein [Allocatelliglobosispora scoriae]